jgi:hypothetical protein
LKVEIGKATSSEPDLEFEPPFEKTPFEIRAALRHFRRIAPEGVYIRLIDGNEVTTFG